MSLAEKLNKLPFWQGLFIFSILLVFIKIALEHPLNLDVSSFVYMARHILFHDKTLYKDIIDINPPLSAYFFVPPIWLAHKMGATVTQSIFACLGFASLILLHAIYLTNQILKTQIFALTPLRRAVAVTGLIAMVFLGNAISFPQRDLMIPVFLLHALLLASLTFLDKNNATRPQRVGAGLYALMALALKPHYIFVLILPETFILLRKKSFPILFRAENITLLVSGVAYAAATLFFFPHLLTTSLPIALSSYNFIALVDEKSELITFAILLTMIALRVLFRLFRTPQEFDMLLIGGLGAYLGYVSQRMGFGYQAIPLEILMGTWMLLAFPSCYTKEKEPDITDSCWNFLNKRNIRQGLFVLLFATASFLTFELSQRLALSRFAAAMMQILDISETQQAENHRRTTDLLRAYANNKPVLFLSTSLMAFPSVVYEDLDVTSRWLSLWPLPAEVKAPPEKQGYVARSLAEDIARVKPSLVLVMKFPVLHALPVNFDILGYLNKTPEFKQEWTHYKPLPPDDLNLRGPYLLYRRQEDRAAP